MNECDCIRSKPEINKELFLNGIYGIATFLFLIFSMSAQAIEKGDVRFTGDAKDYAGSRIVFYKTSNFVIPETCQIAEMPIDKVGNFDFSFVVDDITLIFAELGRFKTFIYVEPGLTYNIIFPPFTPKTEEEKLSPFFLYEEVPFGIKNRESQALNKNIVQFSEEFDYFYNTNAVEIFKFGKTDVVQELESLLEQRYTFSHPYFNKHKQLCYLKLQQLAQRTKTRDFLVKLSEFEPDYNMPAYWEVIKILIPNFLPQNFSGTSSISLTSAINSIMPFDSITSILTSDIIFKNRDFAEVCLLFTLFESYYNNTINNSACINIIHSAINYASTDNNRKRAEILYKRMVLLKTGSPAPDFDLYDSKNKKNKLKDYSGKFVYLCFVHTRNHACILDMQSIETFEKIFKKDLEIVMIVTDEESVAMAEFLEKNPHYKWHFLHYGGQKKLLEDYNIMAVPAYYLIDPKGNMNLSPAPSPRENFQQIFVEKYQQYKREEIRKNPPKEKSIFD